MQRKPRIVTFCPQGRDLKEGTNTAACLRLMDDIAKKLAAHPAWHPIDAVVFPGGFLSEVPYEAADKFLHKLRKLSPDLQLVIGVDNNKGEQLAIAFNRQGISGMARKIFPVTEDVDGKTMPPITLHENDFSDPQRFIRLANGSKALLCVCYDMFGLGDAVRGKADKLQKAPLIENSNGTLHMEKNKTIILRRAFNAHREIIVRERPDVALATIHRFEESGRESFWQRHGIATASAAIDGGAAIGASHIGKLPANPSAMPLAACDVPKSHLEAHMKRQAHALAPDEALLIKSGQKTGLLRLFKP